MTLNRRDRVSKLKLSIPSAFIGAICGAIITSMAAPVFLDWYRANFVRDSNWEGDWKTITCLSNAQAEWDVHFIQRGNVVSGAYVGATEQLKDYHGIYLGDVKGRIFKGSWWELSNQGSEHGDFQFALNNDGSSFSGKYIDVLGGGNFEWYGSKNADRPECPKSRPKS